ncbi:MAG: hypothetical protein AB1757_21730 [Acidobacteriota bacterium]
MARIIRTPQEKKALSYEKDCRNAYGENDKGSRRSIRRNKQAVNRSNRHTVNQKVSQIVDAPLLEVREELQDAARSKQLKVWKKYPDQPLGDYVHNRMARRIKLGMENEKTEIKIRK